MLQTDNPHGIKNTSNCLDSSSDDDDDDDKQKVINTKNMYKKKERKNINSTEGCLCVGTVDIIQTDL